MTLRLRHKRELEREKDLLRKADEKQRADARYDSEKARLEEERKARQEKLERLWRKDMNKLRFQPADQQYYEDLPVKPGYWFFKLLLTHTKTSSAELHIRIPEMLFICDTILWVKTEETSTGPVLRIISEFRLVEFSIGFPRPESTPKKPIAILRVPGEKIEDMKAVPLPHEELAGKFNASQFPSMGMIQRYVHCRGDMLAITRLFYHAESKSNASSYAYTLKATKSASQFQFGEYILLSDHPGAVEIFPVAPGALKSAIAEAQIVIDFLQKAYSVRIDRIVLDFLKDDSERLWLLSCKGIQLDPSSIVARDLQMQQGKDMNAQDLAEWKKEQLNMQQSSIHCKLCLLPYKPLEMEHVLPFKMLLLFKRHTAHSGRIPFDLSHLRVNTMDFLSHWVRLCEICYLLVLHEYELMETERKLANVLNIPAQVPDVMSEPHIDQPSFMPSHLRQWRFLFYFHELEFLTESFDTSGLYLQYSLFGDRFCYMLEASWISGNRARYHITRLYYFFSGSNIDVKRFAMGCQSQFRVTKGKDWDHVLAQGLIRPLALFGCEMNDNDAICQPLEVLLFKEEELMVKARMTVGLTRDREVNVRDMPISITRQQGIYIPDQTYINSEPLPPVWMEVFTKEYKGLDRTHMLDSSREIQEMYTPKMKLEEIYVRPMVSTHILHTNIDLDPFPRSPRVMYSAKSHSNMSSLTLSVPRKVMPRIQSAVVSHKSSKSHISRPSLSTTSSSKVIYQMDSASHLKSPTFISPRSGSGYITIPKPHEMLTNESIEELRELFPECRRKDEQEKAMSEEQLKDTVSQFLQKRCKSSEIALDTFKKKKKPRKSQSRKSRSLRRLLKQHKSGVIEAYSSCTFLQLQTSQH